MGGTVLRVLSAFCVQDACSSVVGHGRRDFRKAKRLVESWEHFNLGWAYTNAPRVSVGESVIVVAKSLGVWTINPLRVYSTRRSRGTLTFSHRTLHGHQLSGEETFCLEMKRNGDVTFGIETVSQPGTLLAALTYPVVRMYQNKFKQDSLEHIKNKILEERISTR